MNAINNTLTGIFFLVLLSACTTNLLEQEIYRSFFANSLIQTAQFKHRVLFLSATSESPHIKSVNKTKGEKLTIFIEGDGAPWYREKYVKKDPSPTKLLLFEAMQRVKGDKLYLGRPCYFKTDDPRCHYRYWTSHRYGDKVLQSMRELINTYIKHYQHIVFIGHSGGGTLATLLACSPFEETIDSVALITLSANLDTDKWTDHHDWSRMAGSLNPSTALEECSGLSQYHYAGGKDINTPHTLNLDFYEKQKVKPIIYQDANHSNWLKYWPDIIKTNPVLY